MSETISGKVFFEIAKGTIRWFYPPMMFAFSINVLIWLSEGRVDLIPMIPILSITIPLGIWFMESTLREIIEENCVKNKGDLSLNTNGGQNP